MVALVSYLAIAGAFISLSVLAPVLVAFGTGATQAGALLFLQGALSFFLFFSILLAVRGRPVHLDRLGSAILACLLWLMVPVIAAVPMASLFGIGYGHALFEAVSAFTTTSADSVALPVGSNEAAHFFRAQLQWLGGLATILTFVLLLGPIRAGGLPKPRATVGEGGARSHGGISRVTLGILRYYVLATIICFAALMLSGAGGFNSIILSFTALSTGGYSPADRPLLDAVPAMALVVMAFFLVLSATSIFWQRMLFRWEAANLRRHRESYFVIGTVMALVFAFTVAISIAAGAAQRPEPGTLLAEALFNAASVVSTSGMETRPGVFALLPELLVIALVALGAATYSTAGGIKFFRFGALVFHSRTELTRLVYPNSIPVSQFGNEHYNLDLMKPIWTMFICVIATLSIGALALALSGMDYHASITAVVAAFANAGPIYSPEWVARGTLGWPEYAQMNATQMSILGVIMLLGRLEIVIVAAILNPLFWLRR